MQTHETWCPLPPAGRKLHRHMQIPAAASCERARKHPGRPHPIRHTSLPWHSVSEGHWHASFSAAGAKATQRAGKVMHFHWGTGSTRSLWFPLVAQQVRWPAPGSWMGPPAFPLQPSVPSGLHTFRAQRQALFQST